MSQHVTTNSSFLRKPPGLGPFRSWRGTPPPMHRSLVCDPHLVAGWIHGLV